MIPKERTWIVKFIKKILYTKTLQQFKIFPGKSHGNLGDSGPSIWDRFAYIIIVHAPELGIHSLKKIRPKIYLGHILMITLSTFGTQE